MKYYKKISKCRICGSKKIDKIVDLKSQYIQGSFIKKGYPAPYKKKIPLQLGLCKNCLLVQTLHTVNKKILYGNYWYSSGINKTMKIHLKKVVDESLSLIKKRDIKILDIGCNDGTLISFYPKNIKCYGIDPSQIIKKIKNKKITKINDYFPPSKKNFKRLNSKFSIITSIAMFYDIDDPNFFVKNIQYFLEKKGIWIFELSYMIDMLKLNSFDTICHEHLEYYSIQTLNFLMKRNNLKIFKVSRNIINGGSIRCYVTHSDNDIYDNIKDKKNINKMIAYEKKIKINTLLPYKNFFIRANKIKYQLKKLLKKIKKENKKIYVLGASTKGNTILQFLGINNKIIKYAVERNKQKFGAKTIGSNIEIISEDSVKKKYPDYYLVLPWHFKDEIIKRESIFIKKGGKLIFPLPYPKIIYKNNVK